MKELRGVIKQEYEKAVRLPGQQAVSLLYKTGRSKRGKAKEINAVLHPQHSTRIASKVDLRHPSLSAGM